MTLTHNILAYNLLLSLIEYIRHDENGNSGMANRIRPLITVFVIVIFDLGKIGSKK